MVLVNGSLSKTTNVSLIVVSISFLLLVPGLSFFIFNVFAQNSSANGGTANGGTINQGGYTIYCYQVNACPFGSSANGGSANGGNINPSGQGAMPNNPSSSSGTSDINDLVNKGNSLMDLQMYDAAITYYDKAICTYNPNNKVALVGKGASLNSLGNYNEAITYFDKASAVAPNYKQALVGKGASL